MNAQRVFHKLFRKQKKRENNTKLLESEQEFAKKENKKVNNKLAFGLT